MRQKDSCFISGLVWTLVPLVVAGCSGSARELVTGPSLGPPVIGEDGIRNDGNDFGQIYTVTSIVEATDDIPEWTNAELPFTGVRNSWNITTTDRQWPFKFTYSYPANNYKLSEAHIVIVTQRDNSDTEAIFVDGVMTGRPPGANASTTSDKVTHRHYTCVGVCGAAAVPSTPSNTYFMDWALTHYKVATKNSFDLNIADLLNPTALKVTDVVNDGVVRIVTGDDSAIFDNFNNYENKPLLMMEGFTVSKTALSCTNSPNYRFINTYIHNDGNSIGQATFATVVPPAGSAGALPTLPLIRAVEFYFDPRLPRVSTANITLTQAELVLALKRTGSGASAIVINGIGVAQDGFVDDEATSAVESWETSTTAVNYWTNFVTSVLINNMYQTKTLNLVSLLGESKVKELLAQGKLNISIAGALATVQGAAATSTRTYGVQVAGPELNLKGEYFARVCEIPNNPNSPLSDTGGAPGSCELDTTSPVASSVQVVSVTNTTATIQWLTNELADSQVGFGLSGATTMSALDATPKSFHSVQLTGLDPYKYYQYVVKTKDGCGNLTTSATKTFRTLR